MEKKYQLWERLTSDLPSFFKKAQRLGLGLITLGTGLSHINGIPANIAPIVISAGSTLAILSQFAVKQYEQ